MRKLSITEIENLSINEVKQMKGKYCFSSYVPMAQFIKKLQIAKVNFSADYKEHTIEI